MEKLASRAEHVVSRRSATPNYCRKLSVGCKPTATIRASLRDVLAASCCKKVRCAALEAYPSVCYRGAQMANKFYVPGEERAERVQDLFATIAPRYDLINDLQSFGLHRYWKLRLLRLAQLKPGERALDLCCGTGDLAFAMAGLGAKVAGLDFSAPMLSVARDRRQRSEDRGQRSVVSSQKSEITMTDQPAPVLTSDLCPLTSASVPCPLSPVLFLRADALRIPCRDSQFDVVTISYGLRNLASFRNGLSEMWRVVRPGGRLLILDFGKPDNGLWRGLYFTYLKWIVPAFGRVFCGDSETYAYILESLKKYPAQNGVAAAMADMDCEKIRIIRLLGGVMSINYGEKRSG